MIKPTPLDIRMMPDRIRGLKRDDRGFPIPWFAGVEMLRHRVGGAGKLEHAIAQNLCWVCGRQLTRNKTFVTGPLAAITRRANVPPCHRSCGVYTATTCPAFTRPHTVACTWITNVYRIMPIDDGTVFCLGEPLEVRWYCQGKPATRREVIMAIDKSLPVVIDAASKESDVALQALLQAVQRMRQYLPERGVANAPGATLRDDDQREQPRKTGTHR